MLEIEVRSWKKKNLRKLELSDAVFDYPMKDHLVYEAVLAYQAAGRSGTHKTKNRTEVSGGTRKMWRQKGTGRARAGTWRSPLWVGGGIIHGPSPRDYKYALPRKVKRLALRSALSDRAAAGRVMVIDSFDLAGVKTRPFVDLLNRMEIGHEKVLVLVKDLDEKVALSTRNLPNVIAMPAREANTYTVVAADWLLATKDALAALEEVFA